MAVSLIESNESVPQFVRFEASETFLCNLSQESLEIDVVMSYQGFERSFYRYVYTYNEAEKDQMTWD